MFNETLKTMRKAKGYTQEELAIKLNVVRQTVSKWEKGLSVPDADVLSKIADILETKVSILLGETIPDEDNKDVIAEQLAKISEQMSIKNKRSKIIWKIVGIILLSILVLNILLVIFGMSAGSSFSTESSTTVIETNNDDVIDVSKEKSIVYHPEYKGVRLDIYAEDENHTHYNVEMQVKKKTALGKRSRYYHSQMVMEALASGEDYETMPDTFVIFVCDFDPFGEHLYCYTFGNECREKKVPAELVRFLKFVTADLEESEEDFQDKLVNGSRRPFTTSKQTVRWESAI